MKRFFLFLIVSAFVFHWFEAGAQGCANPDNIYTFYYNGVKYEIIKENKTWVNAAACAVERGGYLANINSQEEQDSLNYQLTQADIDIYNTIAPDGGGASYVWLGGNDMATEGVWIWDGDNNGEGVQFWQGGVNGNPVNGLYTNWGNEPDNYNNQDGLGLALTNWPLGTTGHWNDVDVGNALYYVVEYSVTGISYNNGSSKGLELYPNPAEHIVIVEYKGSGKLDKLKIFNSLGKTVKETGLKNNKTSVSVAGLSPGVYYVAGEIGGKHIASQLLQVR